MSKILHISILRKSLTVEELYRQPVEGDKRYHGQQNQVNPAIVSAVNFPVGTVCPDHGEYKHYEEHKCENELAARDGHGLIFGK